MNPKARFPRASTGLKLPQARMPDLENVKPKAKKGERSIQEGSAPEPTKHQCERIDIESEDLQNVVRAQHLKLNFDPQTCPQEEDAQHVLQVIGTHL